VTPISTHGTDFADLFTTISYVVAAFLSGLAASRARDRASAREAQFWAVCTVLLVFLGLNEILDLQRTLSVVARGHSRAHGWYDYRHEVQFGFIVALGVGAVSVIGGIFALSRGLPKPIWTACLGLGFIAVFILLCAAWFHHVSLGIADGTWSGNWVSMQELVGIVIVGVAAWTYPRRTS
jgi:hypothetical protein